MSHCRIPLVSTFCSNPTSNSGNTFLSDIQLVRLMAKRTHTVTVTDVLASQSHGKRQEENIEKWEALM